MDGCHMSYLRRYAQAAEVLPPYRSLSKIKLAARRLPEYCGCGSTGDIHFRSLQVWSNDEEGGWMDEENKWPSSTWLWGWKAILEREFLFGDVILSLPDERVLCSIKSDLDKFVFLLRALAVFDE